MVFKRCLLLFIACYAKGEIDHGLLPNCPGSDRPTLLSDDFLNKQIFFVAQANYPKYTYRKRYYFANAVDGIGTDTHFDFRNKKTIVYLDGYLDSSNNIPPRLFLGPFSHEDYNTIAVDSMLLSGFIFPLAARNTRQIGNITAMLLSGLRKYGLRSNNIELFGWSMGGPSMGFTGKHYYRLTGEKIAKMTAVDPSGPCFRNEDADHRLDHTDADFVQVIHTNDLGFGIVRAQGHVDFYVNGGDFQFSVLPFQPFCEDLCGHVLSIIYYYAAFIMHPDKFVGVKCKNVQQAREHRCYDNQPHVTNVMGPKADPSKPGIYYVPVRAETPFFPPKDFLKTRPNYALLYNDALSDVEHFVLQTPNFETPRLIEVLGVLTRVLAKMYFNALETGNAT